MKRVLIAGGSGFIGQKLARELVARGDRVTVLTRDVRRAQSRLPSSVRCAAWSTEKEGAWFDELDVVDAVVHLAGEPVITRWTDAAKRSIEQSRVGGARLLVEAIGRAKHKPSVFVSASATGFYGPQPPEKALREDAEPGQGYLADLCKRWEEAARSTEAHGVRSVQLRIGVVLGESGGALDRMVLPFRFFVGGPIGDGTQIVSWVHSADVVGMALLAIDRDDVAGPLNVVSPNPVSSTELADAIGTVLNRSSWLKVPAFAVQLAVGGAAEVLTTGQRVLPARAIELGYEFHHARLVPALESILGTP